MPDVSVRVPLVGDEAKLSAASQAPSEQSTNAEKTRGLKKPDLKTEFFRIRSSFLAPGTQEAQRCYFRRHHHSLGINAHCRSPRGLLRRCYSCRPGSRCKYR